MAPQPPNLAKAWNALLDDLRVLGEEVLDPAVAAGEQADGLRFLLRMVGLYEEQCLEFASTAHPEFWFVESPTRKIFADCPDTKYRQVQVDPARTYRLRGRLGEHAYLSITAYRRRSQDRLVADLHDGELEVDPSGRFELVLSSEKTRGNWLDLGGDAGFVVVREYYNDRANDRPAEYEISVDGGPYPARSELDGPTLESALDRIREGVAFAARASAGLTSTLAATPNQMSEAAARIVSEMAGTPHNYYQLGYYRLAESQALELTVDPPKSRYWSVHLNNGWLESPEYRDAGRCVCINGSQAVRDSDGHYRFVVASSDPGHTGWLDTGGRMEGVLLARYLLPDGELRPIRTRIVDL
ncbi:MAG: DUF1214 domain-containing protein [Myxococcota bacterium]